MKKMLLSLMIVGVAACSPAEERVEIEAEDTPEAGAAVPEEAGDIPETVSAEDLSAWDVRLDDPAGDPAGFHMVQDGGALSIETGPAGIAWRPIDLARGGAFEVSADFAQREAPEGHREAYGVFVGGRNLGQPDQTYTYFLVRGTGEYLVKRRVGEETETLVDWTANDAVRGATSEGDEPSASNTLSVRVEGDEVRFAVNGTVVETLPRDDVRPHGLAGVRVNHRLDVTVRDWRVTGEQVGQEGVGEPGAEGAGAAGAAGAAAGDEGGEGAR